MAETQSSVNISTRLERIAKLAKEAPTMAFRTLAHHIDIDFMREAHRLTRKEGAVGVDGQTAEQYAQHLESNLASLLERAMMHVVSSTCFRSDSRSTDWSFTLTRPALSNSAAQAGATETATRTSARASMFSALPTIGVSRGKVAGLSNAKPRRIA